MNIGARKGGTDRPKSSILMMIMLGTLVFSIYKLVLVDQLGFCYRRLWFVSDRELTLNVLDGLMKKGVIKLDASDTGPETYLEHHPTCCNVIKLYPWESGPFSRGLTYFGSADVYVSFEVSEPLRHDYGGRYYEYISDCTSCGETVGNTGSSENSLIEERKPASN